MTASPIIEARNVTAAYENVRARTRLIALSDVDLGIAEGEFVLVEGGTHVLSNYPYLLQPDGVRLDGGEAGLTSVRSRTS